MTEKSVVISLPENEDWVGLLKMKKDDYDIRLAQSGNLFKAPEIRTTQLDYALAILNHLLEDGSVSAHAISHELANFQESNFDEVSFNKAFGIILRYTQDKAFLIRRLAL